MTAADRIAKRIRPELEAAAASENLAAATAHVTRALEILRPFGPLRHKRIPSVKAPGKTKEERREERNSAFDEIRKKVYDRAEGRCEVCGVDAGDVLCQAHHLISGGLRRHRESVETVMLLCADCHRAYHRSVPAVLAQVREWCLSHNYNEAGAAVTRRIDKLEAA